MQKVELKPKQIFWPKKTNTFKLWTISEKHFTSSFGFCLSLQPKIACGLRFAISQRFAHVRRAWKSSSITVNLLKKRLVLLNKCDQPRRPIHPSDSVQWQSRQSMLKKRPCLKIYFDNTSTGGKQVESNPKKKRGKSKAIHEGAKTLYAYYTDDWLTKFQNVLIIKDYNQN